MVSGFRCLPKIESAVDFLEPGCQYLRHAYATHSREHIETLRQLMRHNSIETNAGYRHPIVEAASNPLDDLIAQR